MSEIRICYLCPNEIDTNRSFHVEDGHTTVSALLCKKCAEWLKEKIKQRKDMNKNGKKQNNGN